MQTHTKDILSLCGKELSNNIYNILFLQFHMISLNKFFNYIRDSILYSQDKKEYENNDYRAIYEMARKSRLSHEMYFGRNVKQIFPSSLEMKFESAEMYAITRRLERSMPAR